MPEFKKFKDAVHSQFVKMQKEQLFYVEVDKHELYNLYLSSFPEGTNEIFRERTEHDCNACKTFIRGLGNVVIVKGNNKLESVWDIECIEPYNTVAKALSKYVKAKQIKGIYSYFQAHVGVDKSVIAIDGGKTITYNHLFASLPSKYVVSGAAYNTKLSEKNGAIDAFYNSLTCTTVDAVDIVLDLIAQGSLYRGEEFKAIVEDFRKQKIAFDKVEESLRRNFAFKNAKSKSGVYRAFKNTVIGTLVVDLSDGKDIEQAVKSYETKVAPHNYKRPTSLVTKKMVDQAKETIEELGLMSALERRYALVEDISVSNVLFVDRSIKKRMDVFDDIAESSSKASDKKNTFDKVEEMSIDDFIANIVPRANKIEIMMENSMQPNLVSLIAPVDKSSGRLFKWGNNFSWSYNGEVADSIKERVKKAGGKVDGFVRCSLSWFNYDDLDLHVVEPNKHEIYYSNKISRTTLGVLDVDMNAGGGVTREAVENITWPSPEHMIDGEYVVKVHNFAKRENVDLGFELEFEYNGEVLNFSYDRAVGAREMVEVLRFKYNKKTKKVVVSSKLKSSKIQREFWGIITNSFVPVNAIMYSPNHWDGEGVGNKHFFFMLDGCINPDQTRGFYNEYLDNDLTKHRKVFEILGARMRVEHSDQQLSGLGFSSTQRNSVVIKVSGSFNRTIKVNF